MPVMELDHACAISSIRDKVEDDFRVQKFALLDEFLMGGIRG